MIQTGYTSLCLAQKMFHVKYQNPTDLRIGICSCDGVHTGSLAHSLGYVKYRNPN